MQCALLSSRTARRADPGPMYHDAVERIGGTWVPALASLGRDDSRRMRRLSQLRPDLRDLVVVERDRDVLRLHVEIVRIAAAVSPDAGRLHAAERRRQMTHVL